MQAVAELAGTFERERERTLALVERLDDATLEAQLHPIMSPLCWDLAHIAAYEDLWLNHRLAGRPLLRADLAATYDAFETPRAARGDVELLGAREARGYLADVRARSRDTFAAPSELHELVLRHELQHRETMLQTMQLARLQPFAPAERPPAEPALHGADLDPVLVPAGPFEIGTPEGGFAYDNERPAHRVTLGPYGIGRAPITNATFLHFCEGGGYERRTLWSEEAWQWKEQYDITHPLGWTGDGREWRMGRLVAIDPDAPVAHVSWFEAAALAAAHGARLPTEAEWEKAATWDQATSRTLAGPDPGAANLGQQAGGPFPPRRETAAPSGAVGLLGDVWEWTASPFLGYPGFRPHPYREYSEVFFGPRYRVLRGGSWATARRVATPTFRNWDLPERRQIFAGVRLAWDA